MAKAEQTVRSMVYSETLTGFKLTFSGAWSHRDVDRFAAKLHKELLIYKRKHRKELEDARRSGQSAGEG